MQSVYQYSIASLQRIVSVSSTDLLLTQHQAALTSAIQLTVMLVTIQKLLAIHQKNVRREFVQMSW